MINDVTQCGLLTSHLKHTEVCITCSKRRMLGQHTEINTCKMIKNEICQKSFIVILKLCKLQNHRWKYHRMRFKLKY